MNMQDKFWLAGLLEGEGSFRKGPPCKENLPIISIQMTDKDVLEKVATLFNVSVVKGSKPKKDHHKQVYIVTLRGAKAVEVMTEIKSLMGHRRQEQINKAIESYKPKVSFFNSEQILKIKQKVSNGEKHKVVAKEFGVDRSTISHIVSGKSYKNLNHGL